MQEISRINDDVDRIRNTAGYIIDGIGNGQHISAAGISIEPYIRICSIAQISSRRPVVCVITAVGQCVRFECYRIILAGNNRIGHHNLVRTLGNRKVKGNKCVAGHATSRNYGIINTACSQNSAVEIHDLARTDCLYEVYFRNRVYIDFRGITDGDTVRISGSAGCPSQVSDQVLSQSKASGIKSIIRIAGCCARIDPGSPSV
ncbi:hypothetical protein D3C72_1070600 [compost metagenome]